MRAVNLLPEDLRPGHRLASIGRGASARRVLGGSGIAAGVLALAFAGVTLHQRGVVDDRRTALADVETRLTRRPGARGGRGTGSQRPLRRGWPHSGQSSPSESPGRTCCATSPGSCPASVVLQNLTATSPTLTGGVPGAAATPSAAGSPDGLHGQRLGRLAGARRSGSRSTGAPSVAVGRDAPDELAKRRSESSTPVQFTIAATLSPAGGG